MRVRSRGEEMKLKQYKLKRDLPTFKAGGEFIICCGNLIEVKPDGTFGVCAYSANTLKKFPNILTEWFEEIKSAEPLIKDEKIRKAIRAWAEANDVNVVSICALSGGWGVRYDLEDREGYGSIDLLFKGNAPLGVGYSYTIAELCGEEKE